MEKASQGILASGNGTSCDDAAGKTTGTAGDGTMGRTAGTANDDTMGRTSGAPGDDLDRAIDERFLAPTRRERTRLVGLEFELPIVNRKEGEAVDFAAVQKATEEFLREFSFREAGRDDDGLIYTATDERTGDILSFDCSYNTLELSFGKEESLRAIHERFTRYYAFAQEALSRQGHALTGMGINPRHAANRNVPVATERYRMLYHHLSSYESYGRAIPFHPYPNFGMFSCANQIQIDVEEGSLAETLNAFTRLEPLKALILSNSPWREGGDDVLCFRDDLWRNSLHGLNRHNVDMYGIELGSPGEVARYIRSMSLYCVERDGKYVNFRPIPLEEYFASDAVEGEYFDGARYRPIRVRPELEDLKYLRSFKFEDLTFRGTVEFRSVCEQPVREIMASAALHAGLMEEIPALSALLAEDRAIYRKGYNAPELRRIFVRRKWPGIFRRDELSSLLLQALDIARDGLKKRGMGEDAFLTPLYGRAERLQSPALEMLEGLERGRTMESYIEEYGRLA